MIDMSYDYDKPQRNVCECGDTECLGDAAWFAQASADIAMQLAEQVPGLDSPLLKLAKERNEARDLVKRLLYTATWATHRRTSTMRWLMRRRRSLRGKAVPSERPRLRRPLRRRAARGGHRPRAFG
jgi:hypothetical protein